MKEEIKTEDVSNLIKALSDIITIKGSLQIDFNYPPTEE